MKRKLLPRLIIAAAAMACAGTSHAVVLNFDAAIDTSLAAFAPLLGDSDRITTQGFFIDSYSTKTGAQPGDLVGAVVNGSDLAATCAGLVCPTNNATNFLAALNDGYFELGRLDSTKFSLNSFDASFIAASGATVPPVSLILRIVGLVGTAAVGQQDFQLPGPVAGGYSFANYTANAAMSSTPVDLYAIYGFACDATGSCTRLLDKAQFGIDNINVSVVPEPAQWLLMGLGLALVGGLVRRRAA